MFMRDPSRNREDVPRRSTLQPRPRVPTVNESSGLSPNALDCGCDKDCIDGTSNHDCQEDCGCINIRRMIYPPQMILPPNGAAWTEGSAARPVRYHSACIWYSGVFDGPSCTIGEGEDEETVNDEYRWKVWKVTSPPASSDPESPDYHPCVGMWVAELECTTEEPQCDVIQAIFPKVASPCGNDGADCLCPWQFGQGRFTNIYRPRQCKLCVTPYVTKTVPCGSCTAAQLPDALEVTLPEAIWLTNDTGEPYVDGEDPPTLVETPFPAAGKKVKVQYASSGNDVYAEGDLSALVCSMLTNCSPSTDWHSCWTLTSCGHNYAGVIRNAFPFGDDPVDIVVVVIQRSDVRNPGSNGEEEIGSEKATVLIFSTAGDCFNSLEGAQLHRLIYTHYEDGQDYDEDHYIGAEGGIMFPLENNLCTAPTYEAYPGQHYSAIWEGAGNDPGTTPAADDEIANYGNTEPVTIARTSRVATTSGHPGAACGADGDPPKDCAETPCKVKVVEVSGAKYFQFLSSENCGDSCGCDLPAYMYCTANGLAPFIPSLGDASDYEVDDVLDVPCVEGGSVTPGCSSAGTLSASGDAGSFALTSVTTNVWSGTGTASCGEAGVLTVTIILTCEPGTGCYSANYIIGEDFTGSVLVIGQDSTDPLDLNLFIPATGGCGGLSINIVE